MFTAALHHHHKLESAQMVRQTGTFTPRNNNNTNSEVLIQATTWKNVQGIMLSFKKPISKYIYTTEFHLYNIFEITKFYRVQVVAGVGRRSGRCDYKRATGGTLVSMDLCSIVTVVMDRQTQVIERERHTCEHTCANEQRQDWGRLSMVSGAGLRAPPALPAVGCSVKRYHCGKPGKTYFRLFLTTTSELHLFQ